MQELSVTVMSERSLSIREGLHFAAVQGEGVLLDVTEDRYWGLYDVSATIWQGLVDGSQRDPFLASLGRLHGLSVDEAGKTLDKQLDTWLECGLLIFSGELERR